MREIYRILFQKGMLPDEVAKQNPRLLLYAMYVPPKEAEIPDGWEWFYGQ